ncbi:conserved hypothetical protein [Pseudomonas sp. OF001]|uniref:DUF7210 family protein n=1 Tax=Pseudomonas sp. OF001 TaxID=2772300 RepID=UPI00191955C6|nr:hypothetical protein [Pseudomonas sp. OF001]CAD5377146.1 conserved hypothetical protein [Pseudomonas sp. OF001]
MSTAKAPAPVEVTLARPHTHNGRAHQPGDKIEVTADQKVWLEKRGVIGHTHQKQEASNG